MEFSYLDRFAEMLLKLRLNEFKSYDDKRQCINEMIEIANNEKGRILLCESGICDFICNTLRSEKSVKIVTSLCVLISSSPF